MTDEEEIIKLCIKNEVKGRERLFKRFAPVLLGVCCRYIKDRDDAEDVLQDTFIKIFLNIKQYSNKGSFEGWMKKIAANTALQFLKQKQKIKFDSADNLADDVIEENEEKIDNEIDTNCILECLNELPTGYRTIINLYLIEQFSHKEIAEKLGIKESTSRSQFTKARRNLIELINNKTHKNLQQWKTIGIMMSLLGASWILIALSPVN